MNSFSDWKSGSTLGSVFNSVNSANGQVTTNHNSLEAALKGILGEQYGVKKIEEDNQQALEDARKRAEELSKATEAITKMAEEIQTKIDQASVEEPKIEEKIEEAPIENEPIEEALSEVVPTKAYRIFRDKDENFECKISIQGAGLSAAQVRIIFDSDSWNFTFYGKLYKDGRCIVPIKKGIPLQEGARGRARLEVIVDEQLFVPWEDDFIVEGSKKVQVELKDQKAVRVSINSDNL